MNPAFCISSQRVASILSVALLAFAPLPSSTAATKGTTLPILDSTYQDRIQPLLDRYCYECHSGEDAEAEIDLSQFDSFSQVRQKPKLWEKVEEILDSQQMPPRKSDQPSEIEFRHLTSWIHDYLSLEAKAMAGDPGKVVLRRLNHAEYTYTIRDLTGIPSLSPAEEFPVDGAAGEGFINTGDALSVSPALVQKYLDAAKDVAAHAMLLPDGIRFSAKKTRRDWTDEILENIRSFYSQFTTAGGGMEVDLQGIKFDTNQGGVLPLRQYLEALAEVRSDIEAGSVSFEAIANNSQLKAKYLRLLWKTLSATNSPESPSLLLDQLRRDWQSDGDAAALSAKIFRWQKQLWKLTSIGHIGREGGPEGWLVRETPLVDHQEFDPTLPLNVTDEPESANLWESSLEDFRQLFPPVLCYTKIVPVDEVVTLTLFYREDEHLQRLMLSDAEKQTLDRLWDELLYVSREPLELVTAFEQLTEFATQDRPDLVEAWKPAKKPILDRAAAFQRRLDTTAPSHVDAAIRFARQAWRRPLLETEEIGIRKLYDEMRFQEIDHDAAIRLIIARLLTSPKFLYRSETPGASDQAIPISNLESASRLSYFLWSSQPDFELRRIAEAGRLIRVDVLESQVKRMLKNAKTERMAIEFACQWLHLRDFDKNAEKNERLYPNFSLLRQDMYHETVRFISDLFMSNGSILDLLTADHTFLNESLAQHYGIQGITGAEWRRVDGIHRYKRGGLLGMASILAAQSGTSRTSPILRGNWISETLLGERLPRPPLNVPVLPEALPVGLSAREMIEKHSSDPSCAKCHSRIDPYGFALEQFNAVGARRPNRENTRSQLIDGHTIEGIEGLKEYLAHERRDDVMLQFCRKLLGYALGRAVQLSDRPLLETMTLEFKNNRYSFHHAVLAIVRSPQFLRIRGQLSEDHEQN